jgi:hypothetical protein
MIKFLSWVGALLVGFPVAVLAVVAWPLVWLLSLPFRLFGVNVDGAFRPLRAMLFFPSRTLGGPGDDRQHTCVRCRNPLRRRGRDHLAASGMVVLVLALTVFAFFMGWYVLVCFCAVAAPSVAHWARWGPGRWCFRCNADGARS